MTGGGGDGSIPGFPPLSPEQRARLRALGLWSGQSRFVYGDPVYAPTGNLVQQFTDFGVPGVAGFDFTFQRTYNSLDQSDGLFGVGWTSWLDMSLRIANDGTLDIRYPDGHGAYFVVQGDGYVPGQTGVFDTLTYSGATFTLTTPDQTSYLFDDLGRLTAARDRHGNTITLYRDESGHIERITDTAGREFSLTYSGEHISSIGDASGRTILYAYSDTGDLVSVTDGNGGIYRFEYDSHRMTRATDPMDIAYLQNIYDGQGRVIEQINAAGSHQYFNYDTPGQTAFTDVLGSQTIISYDDLFRVTAVQDALGQTERYIYDDGFNVTAYTDKRGNTWTYTYEQGNLLSETDPQGHTVSYTYNETNDVISITDPGGSGGAPRTTGLVYDQGNLIRVDRPDGTNIQATYDGQGQLLTFTDGNGFTTVFTYELGNLVEAADPLGNRTRYQYDPIGRLIAVTNARGYTTRFVYDNNDNIVQLIDPTGRSVFLTYDRNDLLTQLIDRRGSITAYEYDVNLNLTVEIDPTGQRTIYTYDGMSNLTSITDRRGNTNYYRYDAIFQLVEVEDALGGVTQLSHDPNGNIVNITDALGRQTAFEFDALNRLVSQTDPLGGVSSLAYDAVGRVIQSTNERSVAVDYSYDLLDQLILVRDPLGGEWRFTYDYAGNVIGATDANGVTTGYSYDAVNQLVAVIQNQLAGAPADYQTNVTTSYSYDGVGNLTAIVNANGGVTAFAYDELDRLIRETNPLENFWQYAYDPEGNLITRTDPIGNITQYTYDANQLLTSIGYPDGTGVTFQYDAEANLIQATNPAGSIFAQYDALNRPTVIGPSTGSIGYTFDAVGNLLSIAYPYGEPVTYGYDALNRQISMTIPGEGTTAYAYDPADNLIQIDYPNGIQSLLTFDANNRLTDLRHIRVEEDALLYQNALTLDPAGNIVAIHEEFEHGDLATRTMEHTYQYDRLQRLIQEVVQPNWPSGERLIRNYSYDPVGNRLSETVQRIRSNGRSTTATTNYAYNEANQLLSAGNTTFQYDLNGNRIEEVSPSSVEQYSYDYENQLTGYTRLIPQNNSSLRQDVSATYAYDALGRRVLATVVNNGGAKETRTVYDGFSYNPLATLDNPGHLTNLYYGAGYLVATREQQSDGAGLIYYRQQNWRGDVALITNHDGGSVHEYFYTPYGQLIDNNNRLLDSSNFTGPHNQYTLTGKPLDAESGLTYFGARFYDASTGTWLQQDPYGGRLTDPMTLNRYAYVGNSPINYMDPYGLDRAVPRSYSLVAGCGYTISCQSVQSNLPSVPRQPTPQPTKAPKPATPFFNPNRVWWNPLTYVDRGGAERIADAVRSETEEKFSGSSLHNDPADAWRHARWNQRMTTETGQLTAMIAGYGHEFQNIGEALLAGQAIRWDEFWMDLHNNSQGRSGVDPDVLLEENKLRVINPANSGGGNYP